MADGLNNLYVNDKNERNREDFDGSGVGAGKYSKQFELKNNLKSVSLFILLDVIAVLLLIMSASMFCKDVYTKANGQYITIDNAELGSDGEYKAQYEGKPYSFEKSASVFANKDGSLKVYYKGNSYYSGSIMMNAKEYIIAFSLIIAAVILFSWLIYRGMRGTNHAAGAVSSGRFDE